MSRPPGFALASQHAGDRIVALLLLLYVYVDPVQPGRVLAEDLPLDIQGEADPELLLDVFRDLEGHELVHDPAWMPDGVVARKKQLVSTDPPQEIGHHLAEVTRTAVNERHDHGQPSVHIALLGRDPAEVLEAWQSAVLDDEIQPEEGRGDLVDVVDLEGILVEGPDGRPFVHVNILDPELLTLFQVPQGPGIGELPPLGIALPLGRIQLDALNPVVLGQRLQVVQAGFPVSGIPRAVEYEALRMALPQQAVLLCGVEPVLVEVLEVGRLEDSHVDVPIDEDILHHSFGAVLLEHGGVPDVLGRTQVPVVVVETPDEPGSVLVELVLGAGIPQVQMPVDDEQLLAPISLEHGVPLPGKRSPAAWRAPPRQGQLQLTVRSRHECVPVLSESPTGRTCGRKGGSSSPSSRDQLPVGRSPDGCGCAKRARIADDLTGRAQYTPGRLAAPLS